MTILDHSTRATHVAGSTPYSWPWNGDLTPSGTAAIVVEPVGATPSTAEKERSAAVVAAVVEVVGAVSAAGGTVIRVLTAPPQHAPTSTDRSATPVEADHVITAVGIDGFYGSSLDALLRRLGLERLILVGFGLETCVHSTMRSANDRGYECLLVIDACLPYDEALVASSVSMIEMSGGIFGAVGTSAAVVEAFAATRGEKN